MSHLGTPSTPRGLYWLAALFCGVGIMHFIVPHHFDAIIPRWLPAPRLLTYLSGIAEIAGGIGLLLPPVRKLAAAGLILLLIAVYPANIQMLLDAIAAQAPLWWQALLIFRLPWQFVFVWWLWKLGISSGSKPEATPQQSRH